MRFLRSNTAVIVTVGPFYDKTDGVTIETALTITNERITLTADTDAGSAPTNILDNITGATAATANDLNYITGNDAGMMQLELAAADVNRVGRMFLSITDAANHVPVFHEFFVLPQAIYDWFTGVIVPLPANVTQWLGTAAATPTTAGVPEVDLTFITGVAVSTTTAQLGVNAVQAGGTAWGSGAITAASIATGAIDADALAADTITAAKVAADVSAEIADAVWDEDATGHQTTGTFGQAIGDPVADANTIYKAVVTDATGATVGVDVVAVKADTAAILIDTAEIGVAGAGLTDVNGVTVGVGGIATTSFAAGAIDAAALAADAIGASEFAQGAADKVFGASGAALAEVAQAIPSATPRPDQALSLLYMSLRNANQSTATERRIKNDAGTVIVKATMSDDGTTFNQGELVSGP